jgi:uncharacterized membrane protein
VLYVVRRKIIKEISNMPKARKILIRLIPVVMQIIGLLGVIFGGLYSASMIVGAGIGSPTGSPHDSYYVNASWMFGISALVFLVGWIWVVSGFLTAPTTGSNKQSEKAAPSNR